MLKHRAWLSLGLAVLAAGCGGDGDSKLPELMRNPMMWVLFLGAAIGVVVFVERYLHFHKEQIKIGQFISGLKNVLRQKNLVEALSICEATKGPTARLVREAIVERELPRADLKELLQQMGAWETARLERNLWVLATLGQIAPLLGLLGTVTGFMASDVVTDLQAHFAQALIPTAAGLAVGVPALAGYNYLVNEVGDIVLEMEQATMEALRMVSGLEADDEAAATDKPEEEE